MSYGAHTEYMCNGYDGTCIKTKANNQTEADASMSAATTPQSPQKTLLLLGGAQHQVCAIEAAKNLGYRTVLCDYLPDNPGQYAADTFYLKSTTDREAMLEVARAEHIDGVISFGSDAALPSAAYVAETLGLATNPRASVDTLSNKHLFRAYLRDHGFNCPQTVSFAADAQPQEVLDLCKTMHFPVVLKPTDSSGSKGVSIIDAPNVSAFAQAIAKAQEFSRNRILVAEEYLTYEYPYLVGGDIFVANGEVTFWGLMACLRDVKVAGLVPVGKAYPTQLDTEVLQRLKDEVQRLVTSLNLQFGEMNLEVVVGPGGTPYIIELGGRAGGNLIPQQLADISGIDLVEASVRFAMGDASMDTHFAGNDAAVATHVVHAAQTGILESISYDPVLMPHLYRELIYVKPGDHVHKMINGAQGIGHLFLRFDSAAQMWEILPHINELVHVQVRPE